MCVVDRRLYCQHKSLAIEKGYSNALLWTSINDVHMTWQLKQYVSVYSVSY